jgi:hypothetical protein
MSRVLKVSQSNYRLQVQPGGTITLDTGVNFGQVVITGNLDVKGTVTYIESTNTQVTDNVLQLNYGQTGNGISAANSYISGFEIGRGTYSAAQLLFNDNVTHYDIASGTNVTGTFQMRTANLTLSGLRVGSIGNNGDNDFVIDMQNSNRAVLIANSPNYDTYISNDNHLINRKYLSNYVASSSGIAVVDRLYYPTSASVGTANTSIQAFSGTINFTVSQITKAQISSTGLAVNNLNLAGDTISNTSSNNLVLSATSNNVEVSSVFNLVDQITTPSAISGKSKIYSSATAGPGRTGIYFANNTSTVPDELISRNRAVLLSILL